LKLFQTNLDSIHLGEAEGPLKETDTLFSQHIPVLNPSFRERSYALGWIRTQLPGVTGVMGDNIRILGMDQLPVIGEGTESRLVLYHQGATVGYFPSLYQFPESRSGIVVLTNSIALGDQADWIAQCLAQVLFNDTKKIDWLALSEETKYRCLAKYTAMKDEIASKKKPGTARDLEEYVGDYWDSSGLFFIQVRRKPGGGDDTLEIAYQGLDEHAYDLRHYYDDVFEWTLTRDETAKRARYHMFGLDFFLMVFRGEKVDELAWHDDGNLPTPRILRKKTPSAWLTVASWLKGLRRSVCRLWVN